MAISPFTSTAPDDVISFAAFDFGFGVQHVDPAKRLQQHSPTTSSPDSGSAAAFADGPTLEDDDEDDGDADDLSPAKKRTGAAKRGKASSAERRATHNAIERARRESLNGRFLELAGALPTMANVKRPSKSIIVNKSLEWIYESQIREHALIKENNALRAELNEMRTRLNMPPVSAAPPTDAHQTRASVETSQGALQSQPAALATGLFGIPLAGMAAPNANTFAGLGLAPPSMVHAGSFNFATAPLHPVPSHPAQPRVGSPGSNSEAGSDVSSQHKDAVTHPAGSPQSFTSISDSAFSSTASEPAAGLAAVTTPEHFLALQTAYTQQQQYAALASVASAQSNQPWLMF